MISIAVEHILAGMVKGAIKSAIKNKSIEIVKEIVRKQSVKATLKNGYTVYRSAAPVEQGLRDAESKVRTAENIYKAANAKSESSMYRNAKSATKNVNRQMKHGQRVDNWKQKLSEHKTDGIDRIVFQYSQMRSEEIGTVAVEDLMKDPHFVSAAREAGLMREPYSGVFEFSRHDANFILRRIYGEGPLNREQLQEKIRAVVQDDGKRAIREEFILKRIELLKEHGYLEEVPGSAAFGISAKAEEAIKSFLAFSYSTYDANVLFEYIRDNNGSISVDELQARLIKEFGGPSVEMHKQLQYMEYRIEKNVDHGYLKKEIMEGKSVYKITDKGEAARVKIVDGQMQRLKENLSGRFDYYKYLGLLNKEGSHYQVTDLFLDKLQEARKTEALKPLTLNHYHDDLLKMLKDGPVTLDQLKERIYQEYPNPEYVYEVVLDHARDLTQHRLASFENGALSITDAGLQKMGSAKPYAPLEFGWADVKIVRKFKDGSLPVSEFKDSDMITKGRITKLLSEGYIERKGDFYTVTDKGAESFRTFLDGAKKDRLVENFKLDVLSKEIVDNLGNKSFRVEDLLDVAAIKEHLEKNANSFSFGRYDANVVFGYFRNEVLSLPELKAAVEKKFADPAKAAKEYEILSKRLDKLCRNGYISYNKDYGIYRINSTGLQEASKFKGFSFSEYDSRVAFEYIRKSEGSMSLQQLRDMVTSEIKNPDEAAKQLSYLARRYEFLQKEGLVKFSDFEFTITEKGRMAELALLETVNQKLVEKLIPKLEFLEYIGYLSKQEGVYTCSDAFLERAAALEFKVSNLDKSIMNRSSDRIFDLRGELQKIDGKYPTNQKERDRQKRIITGRLKMLEKSGMVKSLSGERYFLNDLFVKAIENSKSPAEQGAALKELPVFETKTRITGFTFDNLTGPCKAAKTNIWTPALLEAHLQSQGVDPEGISKKVLSAIKHADSLSESGLALTLNKHEYQLSKELFDRHDLKLAGKEGAYTAGQVQMISELRDFLNMTHRQAVEHIFKNDSVAEYAINELLKKGVLDYKRVYLDTGDKEIVYYLSKGKGKKEAIRVSGMNDKKIYNSKIHNRPEELRHDLLVYSAYVDFKERLVREGYEITNVLTDKEIRSIHQGSKDSLSNYSIIKPGAAAIEYPDLYIEYEKDGVKHSVNIEVDCGYTRDIIEAKAASIDNLLWYTDTASQMSTITKCVPDAEVLVISL